MISGGIRKVRPALFRLLSQKQIAPGNYMHACGTAFAVTPELVLTAAHVLHERGSVAERLMETITLVPASMNGGTSVLIPFSSTALL